MGLSLIRLVFPFFFTPILFYYFDNRRVRFTCAVLFTIVSLTDFFDGYCARLWHQETQLGALIDPLADKVFMLGPLLVLVVHNIIHPYRLFILLARDYIVMALRQGAADMHFGISVSWFGKIKSLCLVIYIAWALLNLRQLSWYLAIERVLLTIATCLSVISCFLYLSTFIQHLMGTV